VATIRADSLHQSVIDLSLNEVYDSYFSSRYSIPFCSAEDVSKNQPALHSSSAHSDLETITDSEFEYPPHFNKIEVDSYYNTLRSSDTVLTVQKVSIQLSLARKIDSIQQDDDANKNYQKCAKCQLVIQKFPIYALSKNWHPHCLECDLCKTSIGSATYIQIESHVYCSYHYDTIERYILDHGYAKE
jgi:uncharacterized CHY-type Zn-finger protein